MLAESVPKFDVVMSLIGGTLTGPLVYILPPLIFIRLSILRRKDLEREEERVSDGKCELVLCIVIIIVGCVMTASTTYVNVVNTVNSAHFAQPCIYNLSMSLLYESNE